MTSPVSITGRIAPLFLNALCALCIVCPRVVRADPDVSDMSLEQLMNEPVTSVSKRETKLSDSAAAIAVVTREDIRRLGIINLPDALRLVPGLEVARISSNQWAVSSRGFNAQFADKLLVLIDGRSVYSPTSGGVFWNAEDIMLDDVERIEVIRGPGATLWGANAVNGVINIITKRAQDSQGALVTATGGTDLSRYAARYGGMLGSDFAFRAYLQSTDQPGFFDPSHTIDTGAWETVRGGFRIDGNLSAADALTLFGDAYGGEATSMVTWASLTPPATMTTLTTENNSGSNVLARWTHEFSTASTLSVQSFFDHSVQGSGYSTEHRSTYDIEVQHRILLGAANDLVWGAGFRLADEHQEPHSIDIVWNVAHEEVRLSSAFVQDDETLVPDRLRVTLGAKFEHTNIAGSNFLPNLRVGWTPDERQTLWAAVSRAASTPALFNLNASQGVAAYQAPGGTPIYVAALPNPNLVSEELLAYEVGYRFTPSPLLSFDVSSFVNHYQNLVVYSAFPPKFEQSPAPPHVLVGTEAQNAMSASAHGVEASVRWQVLPNWQMTTSYTWLQIDARSNNAVEASTPKQQFQVRSYLDLSHHVEFNAALFYVDAVSAPVGPRIFSVAPYVRADIGMVWKPSRNWSLGVWGQNLAHSSHVEFPSLDSTILSEVPRTATVKIAWTF